MPVVEKHIHTSAGTIALWESEGSGLPLLLLHGNGADKSVFSGQFQHALASGHRLIAIDLPGHGQSDNAKTPERDYTLPALAANVLEVLDLLGVGRAALFGWSLGGHIAIEMLGRSPERLAGAMLTGTPPTGAGTLAMLRGFRVRPELLFSSKVTFSQTEAERFARLCYGSEPTAEQLQAIVRSDGRSRPVFRQSLMRSDGPDQRQIVEATTLPIAMVNGAGDPIVRLRYLESLRYRNLWGDACHVIEGAMHAPFLQRPVRFNQLLDSFMASLADRDALSDAPAVTSPQVAYGV